ncbi:related to isotrichodermin C-15 hydroxylase (cytochrome P-450 monooxygenase CYP65A1) [Phialocephala subalpina]|uniref:Related to isotrichodermin C-15 hydroxylase (Cytochrome P-450 monooxygenase CYP65A1) n=1 Tax=Phialocephala subalpina TaxID=576137 RepID=A0A1L7WDV9_9HELO|nr:related to isotrichodermin C-15 hydroxylase (cytochrome P-450 monooxygenase CYP65A1) [Phialocephala subalpina]
MSDIPFKAMTALSAVSSFVLVGYRPDLLLSRRPSYIGTFMFIWLLSFSAWAFWKIILFPKFFSPLRHLPMPKGGSWWNGHFKEISAKTTGDPQIEWINTIPNDGLIRYLGLLNSERIIVTSPQGLSQVLTTQNYEFIKPSHIAKSLGRLLGVGVLLAEGDEHKTQRKQLMPAFSFRHIKDLYPTFWSKSREMVTAMTAHIEAGGIPNCQLPEHQKRPDVENDTAVLEAHEWASRATLDIIGVAGMGHDFGAIADPNSILNQTYRSVFKPTRQAAILGLLNLFLPGWFVRNIPIKRNGDIESAVTVIRDQCRQLIREKKDKLQKKELNDLDILSVAIESGYWGEEALIDQLMTFLAAGHETTAASMTWATYLLAINPGIQARLRAEVREKLPSPDLNEDISAQQIDHLPYLNAVCNEVLRYRSPVPLTLRDAAHDTTLLNEKIPKGTRVMLLPWAINKSESLWGPDARKFNPDRWIPSETNPYSANGGAASNYSMLTFLHGPRSCIGQSFAKAEFACLLAAWVGRFEWEVNDEREVEEGNVAIKGGVTAKPARGMYLRTKVVEGW